MKRIFHATLVCLLLIATGAHANDYLEQERHYTMQYMGNGVYRFYIPIWVFGYVNNYYLDANNARNSSSDTYIWYSRKKGCGRGDATVHRIATIAAKRAGSNAKEDVKSEGEGFIYVHEGSIVIQSMFNGDKKAITAGDETYWAGWNNSLKLKRRNDDDHKYITYFEFDWYVPQELANGDDFYWGVSANVYKYSSSEHYESFWWAHDEAQSVMSPETPQLFTPYLYALDDDGVTGYGNAAVQYVVTQDPVSYHTSLDPRELPVTEKSGLIFVPTTDSVQRFFSATYQVDMTKTTTSTQTSVQRYTVKSNEIHIPAYHRIYDLRAQELLDDQQSVTGEVSLSWSIRCPGAEDLVPGDMFEVERSFSEDFSNAVTVGMEYLNVDSAVYRIEDNPLEAMRALDGNDVVNPTKVSESGQFVTYDSVGDPVVEYDVTLTTQSVYEPGRPVYYRVRRATSAVWGWREGFAMSTVLNKNNYLAPLADEPLTYTQDPDYENNRKIHFHFHLDNKLIHVEPEAENACELTYSVRSVNGMLPVRLTLSTLEGIQLSNYRYKLYYLPPEGTLQQIMLPLTDGNKLEMSLQAGSKAQISIIDNQGYSVYTIDLIGKLDNTAAYIADCELYYASDRHNLYAHISENESAMNAEMEALKQRYPLPDSVRHTLYTRLVDKVAQINRGEPRCNWDRNAILYLQRILVETGDTIELAVPADSIIRQEDGSWAAHMTDVADFPCSHYRYAVRLDQRASALKVLNPSSLLPVEINGPDLYYNEVAHIDQFNASQGTDRYGVILTWEQTPGGVDHYDLERREAGSNAMFEPLKTTEENEYRDDATVPGVQYEYRVSATYTCNDTTTVNSATTTGSRSPYGMISGRIHYSDGTGCPGVKVRLESEGISALEVVTDEKGKYVFDSLLYGAGKEYSIIPTSTYAQFRFNGSPTTAVTLDAANPVAEGIEFDNISSVRVTGRILYGMSSIPVRDANLLLDGKKIQTSGGPIKTDASGNFEIQVPENHPFTLQAVKDGHTFEGDGYVVMNNSHQLLLTSPLDGVRIWDNTKVRLAGRIVGGRKQALKPLGFGLSTNNLGDDLQLVLELEGDNISHIVRDENDLTHDTLEFTVPHTVHDIYGNLDTTGTTRVHYQKKRIIIHPDPLTGEYCADLYPVKYKITQATARGYATLFAEGKTSEVLDLSNAATQFDGEVENELIARWNAKFSITYRSPLDISCTQMRYGLPQDFYGEEMMPRKNIMNQMQEIPLAYKDSNDVYQYTFGYPVFMTGNYTFRVTAHEDYYYNNDKNGKHEEVRIDGGSLKVYNGLHDAEDSQTLSMLFPRWEHATQNLLKLSSFFNEEGQVDITIPIDYVSFNNTGKDALHVLDLSIEADGKYIEKQAFQAYVTGRHTKGKDFMMELDGGVDLIDVLRDPPGAKSYAFLEKGTTFQYNYSWSLDFTLGIKLSMSYGTSRSIFMGTYMATPPGTPGYFTGNPFTTDISNSWTLPLVSGFTMKHGGSYTFTTNERIETANDNWFVGSRGDIYLGVAHAVSYQMVDAVQPMDSITYASLAAQISENVGNTGSTSTVAEGRGPDSTKYYLVIGEELGVGSKLKGTFAYSQDYILTVLLPQLIKERDKLLVTGDSATIQQIADAQHTAIYWSHVLPTDTTFALTDYEVVYPSGEAPWMKTDKVDEYNKTILSWLELIKKNEEEKISVRAGVNADLVDNYFISNGVKLTHTESYNATETRSIKWDGIGFNPSTVLNTNSIAKYIQEGSQEARRAVTMLINLYQVDGKWKDEAKQDPMDIETQVPGAKVKWHLDPIFDMDYNRDPNYSTSYTRTAGFVLEPDEYSYMNISVLRRREPDNDYNNLTSDIRETVDDGHDYDGESYKYGSFVYKLNGGATKCPWEGPEESIFYTQGGRPALISDGTLRLENPKLDILNHEVSDVPRDQPAIINIRMTNETEQTFENYVVFKLVLVDASNPNGAKVLMDGFPLTGNGRDIKLNPGQTIYKTLEVYAGQGNDFENITLMLASNCDILNFVKASFSVHYLPTSCDVNISAPHDKWVMNTLSPKDSTGWYLPVVIDGYDINYPNFDHIEFQYKLSKQSDDAWVNLCSYYADSTLYNEASGTKAMMGAGRIENIAFYGERDPMEQEYDLRAVSFCRYGTSFLTKSSPVLTGIKDTRPPVVFGEPEPANSILGVGDHLLLRFNEPIAGNYLDEDNNFQITGITNEIGLAASTALHFDGHSSAYTKAKRDLTDHSFTLDMMIRPTVANNRADDMILFETGEGSITKQLILTKDNHLRMIKKVGNHFLAKTSKPLGDILGFIRVVVVYDKATSGIRFYVGNEDVTSNTLGATEEQSESQERSASLTFGSTYDGDMLEARVWTKALTLEEITATANRSLTGYERELLAYYRMNEGKGETVTDHAHGATLYLNGCSWNKQKGYSLRLDGEPVKLNGNLFGRSSIYDMTLMMWFKAEQSGTLFHSATLQLDVPDGYADGNWHHMVMTVSRTYNNAALFLDSKMIQTYDATQVGGITGAMYLGGNGFKGNIDEFVIFEQALPKSLVELYEDIALTGDEMGLMAYLPFEEQYTNSNGINELRFSGNDRRVFKDANGNVVNKVVPLIMDNGASYADGTQNAPVKSHGVLKKLYFNWAFNNDELMINILNRDYEVNKQSIYLTVRDVEDLNGNPMVSPITWTAFVDRNSLKWSVKRLYVESTDRDDANYIATVQIINNSGKRHQYTVESLPSWLSVDTESGAIDPMGEQTVKLTFSSQAPVGEYSDFIYVTDENGLSEPLQVEFKIEAIPPYDGAEEGMYTLNMSICAKVEINTDEGIIFDNDERDIVYALYHNKCVGRANVAVNAVSNSADIYLTVMGNEEMNHKQITFQLWRASTGKVYDLTPSQDVFFSHGSVYGCGEEVPLILTTSGNERQQIELHTGWNWASVNLNLSSTGGRIESCVTSALPWKEGDLIKNPDTRQFCTYSETNDVFMGSLTRLHFSQMYMIYTANGNTLRVTGESLDEDSMKIQVRGDGQWSPMPCLLDQRTSVTDALADYYQKAGTGDMIKSHNRFATFSADKRWVGDLTALQPGEGYLFRRMAPGSVVISFYNSANNAPRRANANANAFSNPNAATNMTMIAEVQSDEVQCTKEIRVYVGDELAGVATPVDSLYFITIQSDKMGELRFEMNGETLMPVSGSIHYQTDAHHGSLNAPIILKPAEETGVYKIIENDHVVIIRNNEKYDVTGKKL